MTSIVGGHELGLLDSSASIANLKDRLGTGTLAEQEEVVANVSNGNLVLQERDALIINQGHDLDLVRTYNSRGQLSGSGRQRDEDAWRWSFEVTLEKSLDVLANGTRVAGYALTYGDGTLNRFVYDDTRKLWVSTDGAGSHETLQVGAAQSAPLYVVTRADRSRYEFDANGRLTATVDRHGIRTTYRYRQGRVSQIVGSGGRALTLVYERGQLTKVIDDRNVTLVQYVYGRGRGGDDDRGASNAKGSEERGEDDRGDADRNGDDRGGKDNGGASAQGRLLAVIDRLGLTTRYSYNADGTLARIELPKAQVVNGVTKRFEARTWSFKYADAPVEGPGRKASAPVLSEIVDALGNRVTFDYAFRFSDTMAADDRDIRFANPGRGNFFVGGTTTVVDALGNARSSSNAAEFVAWRTAHGYYATYDAKAIARNATLKAQYEAIRAAHTIRYSYDADGYITEVIDQQGNKTTHSYDLRDNLTSITRQSAPNPTNVGGVIAQNSTYTHDAAGNVLTMTDGDGNKTVYTYTATNQLATLTQPMGEALATLDDLVAGDGYYRAKRLTLGLNLPDVAAASLSAAQQSAIRALYTLFITYDDKDRPITRITPGGDREDLVYDAAGNVAKTIFYLDASDLTSASKQQVTTYAYDASGNNVSTVDPEGNTTTRTFDAFGNVLTLTDARGGVTVNTYDASSRLTSTLDPNGNLTSFAYDAVGNQIGLTDANGHSVTQIFDANNRLIATLDPSLTSTALDRRTNFTYDALGNKTSVTDANGHTTTYSYDTQNRLVDIQSATVADVSGAQVSYHEKYTYDGLGNVLSLTDNNGNLTRYSYTNGGLLKSFTDAAGNITDYLYDADRQRVQITVGAQLAVGQRKVLKFDFDEEDQRIGETDALGGVKSTAYDAVGNVVSLSDENGHTTDYAYDRNNRLLTETLPAVVDPATGQSVRHTRLHQYDANGNEVATTDELGRVTTFTFDKGNRAVMRTDANAIQTVWRYDSRDNVVQIAIGVQATADTNGNITITNADDAQVITYAYDAFNQRISTTDGVGNALAGSNATLYQQMRQALGLASDATTLSSAQKDQLRAQYTARTDYDNVGNVLSETDHRGNATSYAYDALNRLISSQVSVSGAPLTMRYAYDGNGNLVQATDRDQNTHTYVYDKKNRLTDTTDALGMVTHDTYDVFGNRLTSTQGFGTTAARTTTWVYDLNDRRTQMRDALNNGVSYEYDAVGNRIKTTDARGGVTQYVYDARNRNIQVIDPLSLTTKYEYDAVGNRITIVDGSGATQRFTFDPGNRMVQMTDGAGTVVSYAYDVLGNVATLTTAAGVTRYVYDAEGNLREVTDALGNVSRNDYDANFNLASATDANGNATTFSYDELNRRLFITDPSGADNLTEYDPLGNVTTQVDALGNTTTYTYDAESRLLTRTDALGHTTTYAYDVVGNRVSMTDANGHTTTYAYDANGRLTQETDALGHKTRYAYDANGNITGKTNARGFTTTYAYDADNRVSTITDPLGGKTIYGYDGMGRRTQVTDANGNLTQTQYRGDGKVSRSIDALGFITDYTYDNRGNQTARIDRALTSGAVDAADHTTAYAYDALDRLISITDPEGGTTTYVYDKVGNRLSSAQLVDAATNKVATTRYAYDAVNRKIAMLTAEGYLTTYAYDAAGQQIAVHAFDDRQQVAADGSAPTIGRGSVRTDTMEYDAAGRLSKQTDATGVVTRHEYDAVGNRTAKVEAADTTANRRSEARYDAANRLFETVDANGSVTHTTLDEVGNQVWVVENFQDTIGFDIRDTVYTYDANDRLVNTDAGGAGSAYAYDAVGNLTSWAQVADGSSTIFQANTFTYDRRNSLVKSVNAAGVETDFTVDRFYNVVRKVVAASSPNNAETVIEDYRFDRNNRLIATADGNGIETQYQYDFAGNKTKTIQLAAAREPVTRNPITTYNGEPIAGKQRVTTLGYDLDHRLVQIVDPMGAVTTYEYDAQNNQTTIVSANGTVTKNTFDAKGRLLTNLLVDTLPGQHGGILVTNEYDAFGNIAATQRGFADGTDVRRTSYAYDNLDRRTVITQYDRVAILTGSTVWSQAFSAVSQYAANGTLVRFTQGAYLLGTTDAGYDPTKAQRVRTQVASFTYDSNMLQMLSATDGVGNRIDYEIDDLGHRTAQITGKGTVDERKITYTYDSLYRIVKTVDATSHVESVVYDAAGNQKTINFTNYTYDRTGHVLVESGQLSQTEHVYDAFGNEVQTIYALGTSDERTARAEYNAKNQRTAEVDAMGNRTEYTLDGAGNRVAETDALGRITRHYYNASNQKIATVDPEGYLTTFAYDSAGNLIDSTLYFDKPNVPADGSIPTAPTTGQLRTATKEYDGAGNLIREIAPDGIEKVYEYDSSNKLITLTTSPSADAQAAARTADLTPRVQRFAYDASGRLTTFTDVDGSIETYTYDSANNRLSITRSNPNPLPDGSVEPVRKTTFAYDKNNRLVAKTIDPDGLKLVEQYSYDEFGNVVQKTDARGNVTSYNFGPANQLQSVTDPSGSTTRYEYDHVGNLIGLEEDISGADRLTTYVYDKNNRLIQRLQSPVSIYTVAGGNQNVTPTESYVYDAVGNLVQITDANGHTSTRYYDGNNNLIAEINGDGALRTYTYDAAHQILTATLYDERLPASSSNPSAAPTPPTTGATTIVNTYDAAGHLDRVEYPPVDITSLAGTDTRAPTATTQRIATKDQHFYDAFGQLVEIVDRNGNRTVNYYDEKGRIVASVNPSGYLNEQTYDSSGNAVQTRQYRTALNIASISSATRPAAPLSDANVTDRTYDTANRLVSELSPTVSVATVSLFSTPPVATPNIERILTTYAYDANGNKISRTLASGTSDAATERYYYDKNNRMVGAFDAVGTLIEYTYDGLGNRTAQFRYANQLALDDAPSDFASFKTLIPPNASQDQQTQFQYDRLGRLISESVILFNAPPITRTTGYDAAGNVTLRIDEDGYQSTFEYDGMNRMVKAHTPDGATSVIEYDSAGHHIHSHVESTQRAPAQAVAVVWASGTSIGWSTVQPGVKTWVVYGSESHAIAAGQDPRSVYPTESPQLNGDVGSSFTVALPNGSFFRVLTEDASGNISWTQEYKLDAFSEAAEPLGDPGGSLVTTPVNVEGLAVDMAYNRLGTKIASNEDGVWRTFDVDASGNALVTHTWGTQDAQTSYLAGDATQAPIDTYTAYDAQNRVVAQFDAAADVAAQVTGGVSGMVRAVTRTTYDYAGRIVQRIAPSVFDGTSTVNSTVYTYDAVGNLVRTDWNGRTVSWTYNRRGNANSETDSLGNTRYMIFTPAGRLVAERDAVGRRIDSSYDAFGRMIMHIVSNSITGYTYDQADRLVSSNDALGNIQRRYYDNRGNELWLQDANNNWFGKGYDGMGRVVKEVSFQSIPSNPTDVVEAEDLANGPNAEIKTITYDPFGNIAQTIDEAGTVDTFAYGEFGRMTSRLRATTQKLGTGVTIAYDRFGRKVSETSVSSTDPFASTWIYDDAGRITKASDAFATTDYTYYVTGQRATELVTRATPAVELRNATYDYDIFGQVVSFNDKAVTSSIDGTTLSEESLSYRYDLNGNLLVVSERSANGPTQNLHTYTFDAVNRVISDTSISGVTATYQYDDQQKTVAISHDGIADQFLQYDALGRITFFRNSQFTNVPIDTTWQYDKVGNVIRFTQTDTLQRTITDVNTYSNNNVLVSNVHTDADGSSITTTWDLDGAGKTISRSQEQPGFFTTVYAYFYNGDAQEESITAGTTSSTTSVYQAGRLVNYTTTTAAGTAEKQFVYDNDGKIVLTEGLNQNTYLYINGEPAIGWQNNDPIPNVSDFDSSHPTPQVEIYTVRGGETLQALANAYYGNPDLWFVIADANGLQGSEPLKEGQTLQIPGTAQIGRITSQSGPVYNENDIIGNQLPYTAPPQALPDSSDKCTSTMAIIVAVVIALAALVATALTAGIAAPALAAAIGIEAGTTAATVFGVTATVVAGALIGGAASAITQGAFISYGLQKSFSWSQFGIDVGFSAASALASGITGTASEAVAAALKVGKISTRAASIAKAAITLADTAANVGATAGDQAAENGGRITQPWMLAIPAIPVAVEVFGTVIGRAVRALRNWPVQLDVVADLGTLPVPLDSATANALQPSANPNVAGQLDVLNSPPIVVNQPQGADLILNADVGGSPGALSIVNANAAKHLSTSIDPLSVEDTVNAIATTINSANPLDAVLPGDARIELIHLSAGQSADNLPLAAQLNEISVSGLNSNPKTLADAIGLQKVPEFPGVEMLLPEIPSGMDASLDSFATGAADAMGTKILLQAPMKSPAALETAPPVLDFAPLQKVGVGIPAMLGPDVTTVPFETVPIDEIAPNITSEISMAGRMAQFRREQAIPEDAAERAEVLRGLGLRERTNTPGLPDYNESIANEAVIEKYRKDFQKRLGVHTYDTLLKEVTAALEPRHPAITVPWLQQQVVNEYLSKGYEMDHILAALVGVRTYTAEDFQLRSMQAPEEWSGHSSVTFNYINRTFRYPTDERLREIDSQVRLTTLGLKLLPEYQGTVYRGLPIRFTQDYTAGTLLTERAFLSTSKDLSQALDFAGKNPDGALVVIDSLSGHDITEISMARRESEILIAPNSRYVVLGVDTPASNLPLFEQLNKYGEQLAVRNDISKVIYMSELPT